MQDSVIAFIGSGNMGRCLIGGLINNGVAAENIRVADHEPAQLQRLRDQYPVVTHANNLDAVAGADIVVLAVKPQAVKGIVGEIASRIQGAGALVISIAAGIRSSDIERWLGGEAAVVRVMPNTPALVGSGAAALYRNARVTPAQADTAEAIMRSAGLALWLDDEQLLDAVTAVSGSGPAYFFLLMDAMEQAGINLGLEPEQARLLTLQTAYGAARMALESSQDPAALRRQVTSPGGTTEAALRVMQGAGLSRIIEQALQSAAERARELADELGGL